uniref:Rho guanine nucleotide exchange factor 7 n=1 Tax=Romanomermis culicivorax TaxID=13658 RepID=A0A915JZH8_ROMCU
MNGNYQFLVENDFLEQKTLKNRFAMPSLTFKDEKHPCCAQLCFKRGDVITLTQNPDEGWWEGTLNEKTGWFPSGYVEIIECKNLRDTNISECDKNEYQRETVENLLKFEESHVVELQELIDRYLLPLESRQILNPGDYRQLMSNIVDILQHHSNLLKSLTLPNTDQKKIGGAFLKFAPILKNVLNIYCENHPFVVKILTNNK